MSSSIRSTTHHGKKTKKKVIPNTTGSPSSIVMRSVSLSSSNSSLLSFVSSASSLSSRWVSTELAVELIDEIFRYLSGTDRLTRIERTCRFWSNHSKDGIGWYHLDINEWKVPSHGQRKIRVPYFPWHATKSLLNKRINPNGKNSNSGIRSVSGNMTIYDWIDMLPQLPRLQYADVTIHQLRQHTRMAMVAETLKEMTNSLSSSKLISLSLVLEIDGRGDDSDDSDEDESPKLKLVRIPTIPSLMNLEIYCRETVDMVSLSPLPSLRTLTVTGRFTIDSNQATTKKEMKKSSSQEGALPMLVHLKTPVLSFGILSSCCNTLRSLEVTERYTDDGIDNILNANLSRLTSLVLCSVPSLRPLPLIRLPALRRVLFDIPSSLICAGLLKNKAWLVSTLSSATHIEEIEFCESSYPGVILQAFHDVILGLPLIKTINGQARDKWMGHVKERVHALSTC
jgi:hypothetical protein